MTVNDRMYNLTHETTEGAFKAALKFQETNFGLVEAMMKAYQANLDITRDFAMKILRQSEEVQKLWFKYFDETANVTQETIKSTTKDFTAHIDGLGREVRNVARKAEQNVAKEPVRAK